MGSGSHSKGCSHINKRLDKTRGAGAREDSQFAGCHESHSKTRIPPVPNTATFVRDSALLNSAPGARH